MTRKCGCGCRLPATGGNGITAWASLDCAVKIAEKRQKKTLEQRARETRKEIREKREAIKPRSQWLKEAQAAFNAFIRARDADLPCVSCGRFHQGSYDAGHYRSVGAAPALRFHEDNVHRQCVPCNQHKSGNAIEYRLGLIKRIGKERVEWLEGPHEPKKYTIEDAKDIKAIYKDKLKQLTERLING